ncbi:hypothetical protein RCL1_007279 [Eukaryota sp. TZLM3-RCL]
MTTSSPPRPSSTPEPPPVRLPDELPSSPPPPTDLYRIRNLNLEEDEVLPSNNLSFYTPNVYSRSLADPTLSNKPTEEAEEHLESLRELEKNRIKFLKQENTRLENIKKQKLKFQQEKSRLNKIWADEIIPNLSKMIGSKKLIKYWKLGIPSNYKKIIWPLAIGNTLNLTENLFSFLIEKSSRSKSNQSDLIANEKSIKLIDTDIPRTFPQLSFFSSGPWRISLFNVLTSFVEYRCDVGYVQGMSFIAAFLLLFLEPGPTFICFSNLIINNPLLNSFFTFSHDKIDIYYKVFDHFLAKFFPQIFAHFQAVSFSCSMFLHEWFNTVFTKTLSLDCVSRVFDLWFLEGDVVIYRTALGIISLLQSEFMNYDFETTIKVLKKTNLIDEIDLMRSIEKIDLSADEFVRVYCSFCN